MFCPTREFVFWSPLRVPGGPDAISCRRTAVATAERNLRYLRPKILSVATPLPHTEQRPPLPATTIMDDRSKTVAHMGAMTIQPLTARGIAWVRAPRHSICLRQQPLSTCTIQNTCASHVSRTQPPTFIIHSSRLAMHIAVFLPRQSSYSSNIINLNDGIKNQS